MKKNLVKVGFLLLPVGAFLGLKPSNAQAACVTILSFDTNGDPWITTQCDDEGSARPLGESGE